MGTNLTESLSSQEDAETPHPHNGFVSRNSSEDRRQTFVQVRKTKLHTMQPDILAARILRK